VRISAGSVHTQTRLDARIGDPRRIEKILDVALETLRLKVHSVHQRTHVFITLQHQHSVEHARRAEDCGYRRTQFIGRSAEEGCPEHFRLEPHIPLASAAVASMRVQCSASSPRGG
jgi:hypothetical protein